MVRTVVATLSLVLVLAGAVAAQDGEVPTVAVLDFNAFSLSPGEDAAAVGRGLASMMATELANRDGVRVVDRQRIEEMIRTRQLSLSGRVDDAQALQIGQLLGAHYIVVGSVALEPRQARIDLRLLDVGTTGIEKAERVRGSRDDFLNMVEQLADAFVRDLRVPVRVVEAELEIPTMAALAYSRGLDYERRGMHDRAIEMYRQALELFPGYDAARRSLERVRGGRR